MLKLAIFMAASVLRVFLSIAEIRQCRKQQHPEGQLQTTENHLHRGKPQVFLCNQGYTSFGFAILSV
ncbi:hypothetical protein [Tritonibacter mobilis]|uniref:hypothetical protein n=1 Tax=Tritonibacter mobilis TaxID=379347 RepID=UPI001041F831|nr:hypothetical protein [Tritonibacter mobilis]